MDPKIVKKTQESLGKIIKKPPLTEKLLTKPPFRFLHDIMTSVIKTTGFMKGLFNDNELNSENVKDRDSKVSFLQKSIDIVCVATGKQLSVKPAKIVAGHEPEKTNELLQAIAIAVNNKVDNEDCVRKVLKTDNKGEETTEKSRDRSDDRRKQDDEKDRRNKDRDKGRDGERSHDRDKTRETRDKERNREKSRDKGRDGERSRDREEKSDRHREKEDGHREKEREGRHKSGRGRRREDDAKENEAPTKENDMVNGDVKQDHPPRMQRPSSAKGSRRRMEVPAMFTEESAPSGRNDHGMKDDDLPPQVQQARLARPSSARPAPPKRKEDVVSNEPAMRLGSGKPQNLIIDDGRDSDEDETFVVEESAPAPVEPEQNSKMDADDDEDDHGGLVKKIMETKKEYDEPRRTAIERPTISDAQRRKQREAVQREIDKLRASIQTLTRSANPLGKIMDYVQEDLDSMQKELEKWKLENKEHSLELKREKAVTERAVEPLKVQLTEVDQAIKDQLDLIGAVKSNIIRNDQKIEKMLRTIAKS